VSIRVIGRGGGQGAVRVPVVRRGLTFQRRISEERGGAPGAGQFGEKGLLKSGGGGGANSPQKSQIRKKNCVKRYMGVWGSRGKRGATVTLAVKIPRDLKLKAHPNRPATVFGGDKKGLPICNHHSLRPKTKQKKSESSGDSNQQFIKEEDQRLYYCSLSKKEEKRPLSFIRETLVGIDQGGGAMKQSPLFSPGQPQY